jgi:hypothetical protein
MYAERYIAGECSIAIRSQLSRFTTIFTIPDAALSSRLANDVQEPVTNKRE